MSVLRWLVPLVILACLGGFVVGYLGPKWMPGASDALCGELTRCVEGAAHGYLKHSPPQKSPVADKQGLPTLLTSINTIRRGELVELTIQTTPGAVCAVSISYDGGNKNFSLPIQFADRHGLCQASLQLPETVTVGTGRLQVCASACLVQQEFFEIQ